MKRIRIHDTELAYIEQGAGDPVLFVHGTVSDCRSWKLQLEPFGLSAHALAYSRRYHFPNPPPPIGAPYSAATHAADLKEVLDAFAFEQVHLVGGSFGGYVCLTFALDHPERVRSLALAEPPILPMLNASAQGKELLNEFLMHAWRPAREAFQRGDDTEGVRRFIDGVMGEGSFDGFSPTAQRRLMDNAPELRAETEAEEYFTPLTETSLRACAIPVLLLNGERSPAMFGLVTDELERLLPHTIRVQIPNASHGMNAQNASAFNAALFDFLKEHPR